MTTWNKLTPEEEHIIVHKGTERPFTGEYNKVREHGTFICRRCNAPLYRTSDKFDSGCGWPSFDDEIEGAVKRIPDPDGRRTEIVCAQCEGHLGHVFLGERFTEKNTRHCVNSLSIRLVSDKEGAAIATGRAIFAAGCFWGVEHYFKRAPGVLSTRVGYTDGHKNNPTYKEVCYTDTGHAEAIEVEFDPGRTTFENLARLFFEIHDPTQVDRQGPDIGPQYRSGVYYLDEEQKEITNRLIDELTKRGFRVATEVKPATTFWPAEDYHQDYYTKTGHTPYCHTRVDRFGTG